MSVKTAQCINRILFPVIKKIGFAVCFSVLFLFPPDLYAGNESMRTAVDQVGREICFPEDPGRVVSLAPSITEIIYALGREDRLKGATLYSDFPLPAEKLPKVGSYVHLDLERIVALNPDLCIAVKDGNPKATVDRLNAFGIPVYAVNPVDLDSVINAVYQIGDLLNAKEKADDLAREMTSRIKRVDNLVSQSELRPKVFFQIGISPIVTVGENTFLNELIVRAGGINLGRGGSSAYPRFSREEVLCMNPDIIIITSMARAELFERVKKQWASWPQLSAVQKNQIYIVDSNILDRPTPRMVDGLKMLARLIHPELFDD